MYSIEEITAKLNLEPHPEGGYYKETYRSSSTISNDNLGPEYLGVRNCSTAIYFMLTSDSFSAFHRIHQDECWHFYLGAPVELHLIDSQGQHTMQLIGNELHQGQIPQFVVPGGVWFASRVYKSGDYSLVGCTVAPGFDFRDFELAKKEDLMARFPQHSEVITEFTRE